MSSTEQADFDSRIGKGTKVSGKLNFDAPARIEGEAEGEISGSEITVSEGAVVAAHIKATKVTVAGVVSGEIVASERVELLSSARVRCNINTPSLVLNEGATFDGDCKMPKAQIAAA
jgi:cytoskeletal protein CcmA (bactofilin family)